MHITRGDGVAGIKRRLRNLSSDGVRNLVTVSGRGCLKRGSRIIYVAMASGLQSYAISKKARILELKRRNMKIIVLTSNIPYPLRKIRRICACTSQKTTKKIRSIRRIQKKTNTPYSSYGNKIFWKISNVVPTPRNPRYAISKSFDTPYRPYSRPYK
ncbi:hypothetical protein Tco_0745446 [Tanacetum coccineum]